MGEEAEPEGREGASSAGLGPGVELDGTTSVKMLDPSQTPTTASRSAPEPEPSIICRGAEV